MAKPRIIMADTDINYIIPIQLKFVEEFFWKIDLEIISDSRYFTELFSVPQKADILIVSEELYDSSLQRHNINNIFIMTEHQGEEETAELNVNFIYKYTSIKEIFNEITGKSAETLDINVKTKKDTQIVLVYSSCGGVGKTTIAMGISACLTKNYKKVLYINAGRLQSFQRMLDNPTPITASEVYAKLSGASNDIYKEIKHVIRKEIFNYVPPFKAALMSLGLEYKIYEKIALSAKASKDFDFIVIDADTTFDEDKASLLNIADRVIMVANQSTASVFSTNLLVSNINGVNTEKYVFICNNFKQEEDNALISSDISMRFSVNDYIEHMGYYEKMKIEDISKNSGIQKTAFWVI